MTSIWDSNKEFRLVLLGGGHTNTQVLKHLQGSDVPKHIKLVLVSDFVTSLYSGMCPGGVGMAYTEPEFSVDLIGSCKVLGWEWIHSRIVEIDGGNNTLIGTKGEKIKYDLLSIDVGSTNLGLDLPGIRDNTISTRPLKLLMDKVAKKSNEIVNNVRKNKTSEIRIVTVGGGAAGCELSMNFRYRIMERFKSENINCKVISHMITNATSPLEKEPEPLTKAVVKALTDREINILTQVKADKVDKSLVYLNNGKTLPYDVCLWATGAASHRLQSDIDMDERGFFKVSKNLQSKSHINVFGAGDCINMWDYNNGKGDFPPKAGVYAVREGPILIHNLLEYMKCGNNKYSYHEYTPQTDFLRLLNTGGNNAIGCKYNISFEGCWVWKLKDWIDVAWMKKFDVTTVAVKGQKDFNPKLKEKKNEESKESTEEEKPKEYTVEDYAQSLALKDTIDNYTSFAIQWEAIVKMNKDTQLCESVVKRVNEIRSKN